MNLALKLAHQAALCNEVPVGAVIVKDDTLIAQAYNMRESAQSPLAHAELLAIQIASKKLNNWRLLDTTLYVTMEPCLMCAGAILHARIPRIVFGCYDRKFGAFGSLYNLHLDKRLNHRCDVVAEVMAEDSQILLKSFFKKLRTKEP